MLKRTKQSEHIKLSRHTTDTGTLMQLEVTEILHSKLVTLSQW